MGWKDLLIFKRKRKDGPVVEPDGETPPPVSLLRPARLAESDAANRDAGIDPETGRLLRSPRRSEYAQDLEGATRYEQDLSAYVPENHNSRLASIGLGALRGFAGGGLFGGIAGAVSHGVKPSLDEEYAKRVAQAGAGNEIALRFDRAKAASDLESEEVDRAFRAAQIEKALRPERTKYDITTTDTGIVGIDPHDPTKIVETGLRPPKRPESQVQYVERTLRDGTKVRVPAGTALTAEATQGRFETEQQARARERAEARAQREADRAERRAERTEDKTYQEETAARTATQKQVDDYNELVSTGEALRARLLAMSKRRESLTAAEEASYQEWTMQHDAIMKQLEAARAAIPTDYAELGPDGHYHMKPTPKRRRTSGGATPSRVNEVINRVRGRR